MRLLEGQLDIDKGGDSLYRAGVLRVVQEITHTRLELVVPLKNIELSISERLCRENGKRQEKKELVWHKCCSSRRFRKGRGRDTGVVSGETGLPNSETSGWLVSAESKRDIPYLGMVEGRSATRMRERHNCAALPHILGSRVLKPERGVSGSSSSKGATDRADIDGIPLCLQVHTPHKGAGLVTVRRV